MTHELLIRDADLSDASKITSLAQNNHLLLDGLTPSLFQRMLGWLYLDAPFGKQVQFVAEDSDKNLVAHYGGVPFCFQWGKGNLLGLLASNLVVAKDFRKQSPFLALQRSFAKAYPQRGYAFAYGAITRKGVLEPHLRMGWKLAGSLNVYVRPISAAKIFEKLTKDSFLSKLLNLPMQFAQRIFNLITTPKSLTFSIRSIDQFDDSWSVLLKDWMQDQDICAVRSPEVLNWRYCQFSERNYQILAAFENSSPVGYLVLRKMHMREFMSMAVVEVLVKQSRLDVFKVLAREAILYSENANVDLMATSLTDHDDLRSAFQKVGFIRTSEKFSIVAHYPKSFLADPIANQFKRWRLNWFDHDYV